MFKFFKGLFKKRQNTELFECTLKATVQPQAVAPVDVSTASTVDAEPSVAVKKARTRKPSTKTATTPRKKESKE